MDFFGPFMHRETNPVGTAERLAECNRIAAHRAVEMAYRANKIERLRSERDHYRDKYHDNAARLAEAEGGRMTFEDWMAEIQASGLARRDHFSTLEYEAANLAWNAATAGRMIR